VVGGRNNKARGDMSFVGGGGQPTVVPGDSNVASGVAAAVVCGIGNTASDSCAFVGSGRDNTANGRFSVVPGGRLNTASGHFAFAAGWRARANHGGSFVWGDSTNADFASTGTYQFLIRASGGVGIGTNAPEGPLHVLESSVSGATANASSIAVFERNSGGFLSVLGLDGNPKGVLFGDGSDAQRGGIVFDDAINNGLEFRVAGNQTQMTVDQDGDVGFRVLNPTNVIHVAVGTPDDPIADAWTLHSSRRWKTNISAIDAALEKIARLRGVYYDERVTGTRNIGLIAEEVGAVIPEVVAYEENGIDARSVDYARLVALLIEGMKEQQKQIEELRQAIRAMQP
jgi:hypothetical protein